jgi:hypothetical protein
VRNCLKQQLYTAATITDTIVHNTVAAVVAHGMHAMQAQERRMHTKQASPRSTKPNLRNRTSVVRIISISLY